MSKNDTPEVQSRRLQELRTHLQQLLDALLREPGKRPVHASEIRRRLYGYLKHMLDVDAVEPAPLPTLTTTHPNGSKEELPVDTIFEESAQETAKQINTFEGFDDWYPMAIMELVTEEVFDRKEITQENAIGIAKSFLKIKSIFDKIKAARIRGDYAFEQQFFITESEQYPINIDGKNQIDRKEDKKILLSELIDKYSKAQIQDGKWKEHMFSEHISVLNNITEILGDINVYTISRQNMRDFRDTLEKLPSSRKKSKELRNKSIEELLKIKHKNTLSTKTVNNIVESISSMFQWGIREGLLTNNPAKGLSRPDEQADIDRKLPLSDEDIKKIFFSGDYIPENFKKPSYYWVPLIALYSGMRLEEICELHTEDIYQDKEGVWVFDIQLNSKDNLNDKLLKTSNARRLIPIHDELIKLGLLQYHSEMRCNSIRLFPELNKTEKTKKYGKQVSKYFTKLLKDKGIIGKKSFHSLRHSFSNYFKMRDLHTDVFRQVFGHEIPNLAGNTYGERFSAKICYDKIISKLNYEGK